MKKTTDFRYYDYIFIAILLLGSFWFQTHVYFNWDASWHLEAAKRIVHGGASYSKNLYDDNLPMVFWYFIPTVLLHPVTGIFIVTLAIISIHFSVLLCFLLSNVYLKEIYAQSENWKIEMVRYTLLISLLFFPGLEFGQRDMMVSCFVFPYIILIAARLKTNFNLRFNNTYFQILLGFLAAIGIAMNPFYGLIIIALEVQLWLSARKIMLRRPEIITFIIAYLIYLFIIGLFYPDYYTQIIPSYLAFSPSYNVRIQDLLITFPVIYSIIATLTFFLFRSKMMNRDWVLTLWLCVVFSCVVFLVNGKLFASHTIFLIISLNLFFMAALCEAFTPTESRHKNWVLIIPVVYMLLNSSLVTYSSNANYYQLARSTNSTISKLISFFNQQKAGSTIITLSTQEFPSLPMVFYGKLQNISPWSGCWTIRAIAQSENKINKLMKWKKIWVEKYKKIFILQVVSVLQSQKANFVLVDIRKNQGNINGFSFVHFLSQNAAFQQSWKNYHCVKTISHYQIYKRKNKG